MGVRLQDAGKCSAASLISFREKRMVLGSTLVCPLMVVWWEYVRYCERWGFDKVSTALFVEWLESINGVAMRKVGRGRHRNCMDGLGLRPREKE